MKISQNPEELKLMLDYVKDNDVKSVLEIGSRYGSTIESIAGVMPEGSRVVAVDMPNGPWGRSDSAEVLKEVMSRVGEKHDAHLIWGNSRDEDVLRAVTSLGPFDFIFIDGDHTLEGVTADWKNYGVMGKHVGFHDIDGDKTIHKQLEVKPFWNELKKTHNYREFIRNGSNLPVMGIGIIEMGVVEATDEREVITV